MPPPPLPALRPAPRTRQPCANQGDLRCGCGSLLARVVGDTVELKCRRCKQTWLIPLRAET